jgi:hypothetical protein
VPKPTEAVPSTAPAGSTVCGVTTMADPPPVTVDVALAPRVKV